jgi:prepilin-type N-terminal cleavage/methylation domain-containing protein
MVKLRLTNLKSKIYKQKSTFHAFTIVELLVVIIVIGILAAITIVSYSAISSRVVTEKLKLDLSDGASRLKKYYFEYGAYPTSLGTDNCPAGSTGTSYCLKPSSDNNYSYSSASPYLAYCLTATKGSQSNFIIQDGTQLSGPCPILYLDASISNSYSGTGNTWTDLSGKGYNGTLINGVGYSSNTSGGALTFDGVDDYVSDNLVPDSFWNSGSWTVSTWVNFNTVNRAMDNALIGHGSAATNNGLHLVERGARVYFGFYGNDASSNTILSAGIWYNIVVTYDNSSKLKQIYVNGVFDKSSGTIGYSGSGGNTRIGSYPFGSVVSLSGKISNIQLHNLVLTKSEIEKNFDVQHGRFGL